MKIDYLYSQLHKIISTQRFSSKLVLAMGSAYNVKLMQNYLKCYSLKFQAILDNNPDLTGVMVNGCKVFQPEQLLLPTKDNVLIFVYSPKYSNQMKKQLEEMGYQENKHFFIIQDFRQFTDGVTDFYKGIKKTHHGYRIYQRILNKYGKDTQIIITRGATGDVFFNGLYLKEYLKKNHIEKYVLVGDAKGLKKIAALFGMANTEYLEYADAEDFQQCYKFFQLKNIKDVFMWQGSLYLNPCQTRMHKNFNFLDTYTYYIYDGMVNREQWNMPRFKKLNDELTKRFQNMGVIKGKTVIMAPFAYSVKNIPEWIWEKIAMELKRRGYEVFANINVELEVNPFKHIKPIFFSFDESEALLTYAGNFLALRSGLCDIVSMVPCKQVLLYPEEMTPIDYSIHRSDAIFSGFKTMGYDVSNMVEISSPMIEDFAGVRVNCYTQKEQDELYNQLINKVLQQFPVI